MKKGFSFRLSCFTLSIATLTLTACYQSLWKADYASDVANSRNYTVTSTLDRDGNLLVGGGSTIEITQDENGRDIVNFQPTLLKYSAQGQLLWDFTYDNGRRRNAVANGVTHYAGGPEVSHVVVDENNNIYGAGIVAGAQYATNENDYDVFVFKLNADGQLVWQRLLETAAQDSPLTLGVSGSGSLLLGVGHSVPYTASSVEAMALASDTGATLWQQEAADEQYQTRTFLYREPEANHVKPVAITSPNRIAVSAGDGSLLVYSASGEFLQQLPEQTEASVSDTDRIAPACSGDVSTLRAAIAASFVESDLIVVYSSSVFSCGGGYSSLELARYDQAGNIRWSTTALDLASTHDFSEWEEYVQGLRSSFRPFSFPAMFTDAAIVVQGDRIFVSANSPTNHFSPAFGEAPMLDVDNWVLGLDEDGGLLWKNNFGGEPAWTTSDTHPNTVVSKWLTGTHLTVTAQGKPVLALNDFDTESAPVYYHTQLHESVLTNVTSRLVEFDPATGEYDLFAKELDQIVRGGQASPSNGVFKVADNYASVPAWWFANRNAQLSDSSSVMHMGYYRSR